MTNREIEVLRLLARGLSNREIAVCLVISSGTAGRHAENIYSKIGARNRAQASMFAMKHGLVSAAASYPARHGLTPVPPHQVVGSKSFKKQP